MRRALAVVLLATAGCIEDAVVSRDPAADVVDAGSPDAPADDRPASASLLLQVTVNATGIEAVDPIDFETSVHVMSSRGAPADVTVSLTLNAAGSTLPLPPYAPGLYFATIGDYDPALTLHVTDVDGTAHTIPLASTPFHTVTSPTHGTILTDSNFTVSWFPFGGAQATLLMPGGSREIADDGTYGAVREDLEGANGDFPVRVRRAFNMPLGEFARGSLLRVEVINGVVVSLRR